jgi:ribonuclease P protein component
MVVQACDGEGESIRVGFTASRKVGNAVARNRARRRLKALADELLPQRGLRATDYVLIARQATVERDFDDLRRDLRSALDRLARKRSDET